jgi:hypothetical protein
MLSFRDKKADPPFPNDQKIGREGGREGPKEERTKATRF